jgi:para-nitrobenzyl esterase
MIGYTNADMFAPIMAWIGNRFGRQTDAYIYFFDRNAPGDDNRAFHSADLRYALGTLEKSWRPYAARDYAASGEMLAYLANFARCGDPNGPGLPRWTKAGHGLRTRVLHIAPKGTRMGRTHYLTLVRNFLQRREPEA